jgi:hypothetical protein
VVQKDFGLWLQKEFWMLYCGAGEHDTDSFSVGLLFKLIPQLEVDSWRDAADKEDGGLIGGANGSLFLQTV